MLCLCVISVFMLLVVLLWLLYCGVIVLKHYMCSTYVVVFVVFVLLLCVWVVCVGVVVALLVVVLRGVL